MAKDENRCWPGYEPVKGKPAHSQGSCRPKAESKSTPSEKNFKAKRRKQLDQWEAEHKGTRPSASQHLSAPGAKKSGTKKPAKKSAKPAAKKATKATTKKASSPSSQKRTAAKRSTARSAAKHTATTKRTRAAAKSSRSTSTARKRNAR